MQLLWILLSIAIALIWALADRRRNSYNRLYQWLRIAVRYYLAFAMFVYGFAKLVKLQFPFPSLYKLSEPLGNSSPMGLAWSFFGYSMPYNLFTGGIEFLVGLLLLFRRTTLLGALIGLAVMTNVAVMNLCYDIPVKLYSLNLVGLALFLIAHDASRLSAFFFKGSAIPAIPQPATKPPRRATIARLSLKGLFCIFVFYFTLWDHLLPLKKLGDQKESTPLYGIYDIEKFSPSRNAYSSPEADARRWRRLIINYPGHARIITKADSVDNAVCNVDTAQRTAWFNADYDGQYSLVYSLPDKDHLSFKGIIRGDSIYITAKRLDLNNFPLLNRGFHWINETPYNR